MVNIHEKSKTAMALLRRSSNGHLMLSKRPSSGWAGQHGVVRHRWSPWKGWEGRDVQSFYPLHCICRKSKFFTNTTWLSKDRQTKQHMLADSCFSLCEGKRTLSTMAWYHYSPKDRSHLKLHQSQVYFLLSSVDGIISFLVSLEKMKSQWIIGTEGNSRENHWCYLLKTGLDQVLREHVPVGDTESLIISGKQMFSAVKLYINRIENSIEWILRCLFWLLLCIVPFAESPHPCQLTLNRFLKWHPYCYFGNAALADGYSGLRQLFDFLYLSIFITACCKFYHNYQIKREPMKYGYQRNCMDPINS